MKSARVARRYAQALLAIAEEQKVIDRVAADLTAIRGTLNVSRGLRLLLSSPVVREGKKKAVFQDLWGATLDRTTLAFLFLLVHKQREGVLPEVIEEYLALRDLKLGVVGADVRTAVPMSEPQERDLGERLTRSTGKKVRLRAAVEPALKGGLVVRIGDTVVDASVRRQLERLRDLFLAGAHPAKTTG